MVNARHTHGSSGAILLQMLESRLDNVVFRAGLAPTLIAARQLVSHRHFTLNGRIVNIPSMRLRVGDEIQLRERSRNIPMVVETIAQPALTRPEWLNWDDKKFSAKITRLPEADEVPFPIDIQLVVQYYAMLV